MIQMSLNNNYPEVKNHAMVHKKIKVFEQTTNTD